MRVLMVGAARYCLSAIVIHHWFVGEFFPETKQILGLSDYRTVRRNEKRNHNYLGDSLFLQTVQALADSKGVSHAECKSNGILSFERYYSFVYGILPSVTTAVC